MLMGRDVGEGGGFAAVKDSEQFRVLLADLLGRVCTGLAFYHRSSESSQVVCWTIYLEESLLSPSLPLSITFSPTPSLSFSLSLSRLAPSLCLTLHQGHLLSSHPPPTTLSSSSSSVSCPTHCVLPNTGERGYQGEGRSTFSTGPLGPAERAERQRGVLASRVVGASRLGGVGAGLVGAG